jgi:hypothetical protein
MYGSVCEAMEEPGVMRKAGQVRDAATAGEMRVGHRC